MTPFPPAGDPLDTTPPDALDEGQGDDVDEPTVKVGDLVTVRWRDPSSGVDVDVVEHGMVTNVVELEGVGRAVQVVYLPRPTDPIPLDHTVHGRADAPRVERVGA